MGYLRISQIEYVDNRMMLNNEMSEKEQSNQNEEGGKRSEDQNETFCP